MTYENFSRTDFLWLLVAGYRMAWMWGEAILFPYPNLRSGRGEGHSGRGLQMYSLQESRRQGWS